MRDELDEQRVGREEFLQFVEQAGDVGVVAAPLELVAIGIRRDVEVDGGVGSGGVFDRV